MMDTLEWRLVLLCSGCSNVVRPVVALDLDGTLGDYHRHLTEFMKLYWGVRLIPRMTMWEGEGEWEDYFGLTKEEYRQAKLAFRQGGWKRWMPIYPGVHQLFRSVRPRADLWIATSRPWQRLDNIDPDTIEWLRRHRLAVDGLIYGADKYKQLTEVIDPDRIVAVVDDLFEQCDAAEVAGLFAIQRFNVHNRYPVRWPVGQSTIQDIEVELHRLIDIWETKHDH
jgi:hypothetical protein